MTWCTADSYPESVWWIIASGGHKVGHLLGFDPETHEVEVDLALPAPGKKHPDFCIEGEKIVSRRLRLPDLEVRRDGDARGLKGFIYWTGTRWINQASEHMDGPQVELVEAGA